MPKPDSVITAQRAETVVGALWTLREDMSLLLKEPNQPPQAVTDIVWGFYATLDLALERLGASYPG